MSCNLRPTGSCLLHYAATLASTHRIEFIDARPVFDKVSNNVDVALPAREMERARRHGAAAPLRVRGAPLRVEPEWRSYGDRRVRPQRAGAALVR